MSNASRLSQRARLAAGQPIQYLMHEALTRPELISLAAGFVDLETLPVEPMREAVQDVLREPDSGRAALQYGSTKGDPELREALLARLLASDGMPASDSKRSVDQVVLTAGSNQLLVLVAETLLDPGDIVLCAAPTYFVFLGGISNLGGRSVGIAVDDEGIIPDALEAELNRRRAADELPRVKAIYLNSYFENPSSITTSQRRRVEVLEIAKRWSRDAGGTIYVLDDEAYRDLRYYGDDIPSLLSLDDDGDTVIHFGSFSKSFSPGLRVGWGVLPAGLVDSVSNVKGNIDFGSPYFNQRVCSAVLKLGLYDPHIERIRAGYRIKLEAMLAAADEYLAPIPDVSWRRATGGLYVWLRAGGIDTGASGPLFSRALDKGVLYVPGSHCYPQAGESARHDMIRLSFGVQPPDRIRAGIEKLATAIRSAKGLGGNG